jgi:phospholipase C
MPLADIETIVIVILENRSFDHMCGYLSLPSTPSPLPVEGLKDDPAWRDPLANAQAGGTYPIHRLDPSVQTIDDPTHDHNSIRVQIETAPIGGAPNEMGGFVQSYVQFAPKPPTDRSLVMGYYDAAAVPMFDYFARNFAICDHWFAALPTGTQANRLMAMSGESSLVDNARVFLPDQQLVYDWLTKNNVSWCAYQSGGFMPFFSLMSRWLPEITTSLSLSALGGRGRFRRYNQFAKEWNNPAAMPSVIFIEPEYTDGPHSNPDDDHPPTGVVKGQALLADIYAVLTANPARWANTMLIVTYDEHGGFFDHVPPLPIPAIAGGFPFATTGVRVPAFVVSPHVAPGTVHTGALDHTSMLQLLADRFTPGQDYSPAVAARQKALTPLADILAPAPVAAAAPLPVSVPAALRAAASASPPPPAPSGAALADPPNAQAMHNVALQIARDHPDILSSPGWEKLAAYVQPFV